MSINILLLALFLAVVSSRHIVHAVKNPAVETPSKANHLHPRARRRIAVKPITRAEVDVGLTGSPERHEDPPMLGRKSVLMGMLTSGFVFANATRPSDAIAGGTVKPIAATQAASAPRWTAKATYALGQQVISPNNDVVSAKVAHTSSATYVGDTPKWALSSTFVRQGTLTLDALANGVVGDGVTDDRPAIQALLDTAKASGAAEVFFPARTYHIGSATVAGATGYGLVVPPGVSIRGAGSASTCFEVSGVTANLFMVASTLSTTVATLTANAAVGDLVFIVDSTAGFAVGDTIVMRIGQNSSDIREAKQGVFAKVKAVTDGTHLTTDTPAEWSSNASTTAAVNRQIIKITTVAERMSIGGFHIKGSAQLRHGIGVQWARQLSFKDITGVDVGSGILNAQWCVNCSAQDIYVYSCASYGNNSKGRGISVSNVRNFNINNFTAEHCDGSQLYVESYSIGVRVGGFLIDNGSTTRSVQYLIFCGYECDVQIDGFTLTGSNPANPANDSVVSYGPGTGQAHFNNTTVYLPMAGIRAYPLYSTTGFFRCFDNSGALRTFNMNKLERSSVVINLADGASKTAWLRDGLHVGFEVYVSPGVTRAMLTTLSGGRQFVAAVPLAWTAGQQVRADSWVGQSTWPAASAFAQGTKITATVASASGLPGGAYVIVTLFSINYNAYATIAAEPGSEQAGRFSPSYTVT